MIDLEAEWCLFQYVYVSFTAIAFFQTIIL